MKTYEQYMNYWTNFIEHFKNHLLDVPLQLINVWSQPMNLIQHGRHNKPTVENTKMATNQFIS